MRKLIVFLLGVLVGWGTLSVLKAEGPIPEVRTYMQALKKLITTVENIQETSKETAENTKAMSESINAIAEKFGVKK